VLLISSHLAAQRPPGLPPQVIEKVEKAISAEMSRQNIPGLSVAVVTDHQLRWSNGYGMADMENFVPAKSMTVYRLGSVSKPITATAVMQLVERGKLDLDAPIQTYCPAFPKKQWPITTRLLLGHLSGIRHYKDKEIESTRHYTSMVESLEIFKDDPLLFEPGTNFSYTTYGYTVLGCVVEGASGMKFADFVRDNIFRPAGMEHIRVDDVFEIIPNRAQGYQKTKSGELRNSGLADTSYKIPGGGFCSTVEDLAKFAIAVETGVLIKKGTLEQMWTAQKTRAGQSTGYGFGWGIINQNGHNGGQQRISTQLYLLPDPGFAVALMANLEGANLSGLARQIADLVVQPEGTPTHSKSVAPFPLPFQRFRAAVENSH
jgi:CubicO group peptidase (beta-lactamase class C family)